MRKPSTFATLATSVAFAAACLFAGAACSPPPTPPSLAGTGWRCPAVVDAARRTGWASDRLAWVDRIAWRESRCRPDAWSASRDAGAMQIHHRWIGWGLCRAGIACRVDELFDLEVNLRAAAYVLHAQGPSAWATN
jgi:hypothetical protein